MSHLVSIVSKPKSDQDCADELLLYLAVLHVVMGTLPMWKTSVTSLTGLFSDITTFTDRLSEENMERFVHALPAHTHTHTGCEGRDGRDGPTDK